jgi:hypothetical protein
MFGMKVNNMDKDQYFVIRVWYFDYRDDNQYQYNIVSDKSYSMDKALNVKIAQEIMESNPNISYKLQQVNLLNLEKSKLAS